MLCSSLRSFLTLCSFVQIMIICTFTQVELNRSTWQKQFQFKIFPGYPLSVSQFPCLKRHPCSACLSVRLSSLSLTAVAHGPGLRRPPVSRHRQRTPASARPPARARRALISGTCARNRGRRTARAQRSGGRMRGARGMGRIGKWSGEKQERAAEDSMASRGTPPCVHGQGRRRRRSEEQGRPWEGGCGLSVVAMYLKYPLAQSGRRRMQVVASCKLCGHIV